AVTAIQAVATRAAVKSVVPDIPQQRVVAIAAMQGIVALPAVRLVLAGRAMHQVIAMVVVGIPGIDAECRADVRVGDMRMDGRLMATDAEIGGSRIAIAIRAGDAD